MWESRDVTLGILFAVIGFVYSALVGQIAALITGLPGIGYYLIIGNAIWITLAFLLFQGKRWRVFLTLTLFLLLTLPTHIMGPPYDILQRLPGILTAFFADILLNSFYGSFQKHGKLLRWSILVSLVFTWIDVLFRTITYLLIYSPEFVSTFLDITFWATPVIIIEQIVGGYLGYKIYQRVKNIGFLRIS